ncbi:MAG: integrase [Candidatus Bathyarchaeia archaeon]
MKWDKGLDYEYCYSVLLRRLQRARNNKQYCYYAILLTQLRNGSRVSEAVRAFIEFVKTGKRELDVNVSKKKRVEKRLMIIPNEIEREKCMFLDDDEGVLTKRVKVFCKQKLGFNTHSLRYAFITYLLRQGVNPSIIAKITKHSKLDFILTYTQEKAGEEILKNLI